MADAGTSGGAADGLPVDDPVGAPAAQPTEEARQINFAMFIEWLNRYESNEPLKDKKTPKKRKSEPNKKEEALKKKRAKDKAQLAKTIQQLREVQRQQKLINAKKRMEKRRSMDEKDQELIRKIEAEMRNSTD